MLGTVLAVVAMLAALPATSAWSDSIVYRGLGFTVQLPTTVAAKKVEMVDFDTYEFSRTTDDTVLLGAYAGNAPWFGQSIPDKANEVTKEINGLRVTSHRWTDAAGRFNAESLIDLAPIGVMRFPMYIHYWYRDLSGSDAAIADSIIESTIGTP